MFIELVDSLRCLGAHEETWLVAAVTRMDGRHIVEGTLGCPICRREYPVLDGVAWFTERSVNVADRLTPAPVSTDDRITRAAALLGLTESGGIICLDRDWAGCADALAELGAAHVVVLNAHADDSSPQEVSAIAIDGRLPFAAASVRAVAIGEAGSSATLASAADVLRARGRLVAPATAPVPEGVQELARDSADWVAERIAVPSPPIPLRSARR